MSNRRKFRLRTVTVNVSCSSCRKFNLADIFQPKQKSKLFRSSPESKHSDSRNRSRPIFSIHSNAEYFSSSATTSTISPTADTFSPFSDAATASSHTVLRGLGRIGGESVAVEKVSDDPYVDFRRSMLQMITEKEIYSKDDLKELLDCFLQLNSPHHHGIIIRAFSEIWNGVF